jgi:hypothetical protein
VQHGVGPVGINRRGMAFTQAIRVKYIPSDIEAEIYTMAVEKRAGRPISAFQ